MLENIELFYGESAKLLTLDSNYVIGKLNCIQYLSKFNEQQPIFKFRYNATSEKFELLDNIEHSKFCVFYFNIFLEWDKKENEDKVSYITEYITEIKERELKQLYELNPNNVSDEERENILNSCSKFFFLFENSCPLFSLNGYQSDLVSDAIKLLCTEVRARLMEFEV